MEEKSTESTENEQSEIKNKYRFPSIYSPIKSKKSSQKELNSKDFTYIYEPAEQNPRIRERKSKLEIEKKRGNFIDLLRNNMNDIISQKQKKSKKSLQHSLVRLPSEISLNIKSKLDLTSLDDDSQWNGLNEYLEQNAVILLHTDLDIQVFQINQFPGVTVFLYLKSQLTSTNISLPVIILPKPFSSSKLEKMLTKHRSDNDHKINVYCGLCNRKFCKANVHIEELFIVEYSTDKNLYQYFYICVICGFKATRISITKYHIFQHIISKETFCPACNMFTSLRKYTIDTDKEQFDDKQLKEKEISENSSNVLCDHCKTFLVQEQKLLNKIKIPTPDSEINDYKCGICNIIIHESLENKNHLLSHLKSAYIFCSDCHSSKYDYKLANSVIQEKQESISKNESLKQNENIITLDDNIPSESTKL